MTILYRYVVLWPVTCSYWHLLHLLQANVSVKLVFRKCLLTSLLNQLELLCAAPV